MSTLCDEPAFGYRPGLHSTRATPATPIPERVQDIVASDVTIDLSQWAPAPRYQGSLGSCTAHAGRGAVRGLMAMAQADGQWTGEDFDLSTLGIYQQTLANEGRPGVDAGASAIAMLRVLSQRGLPDEAAWPYSEALPEELPPRAVWTHHRLVNFWPVAHRRESLRAALALGCPLVVGVPVFSRKNGMGSARAFATGETREPESGDEITGWHLLSVWTHDPVLRLFVVQHSWRGYGHAQSEDADAGAWRTHAREKCLGTIPELYLLGRANEIFALGAVK